MLIEKSLDKITVGEIVTADFRAARLFKEVGIDFCCGGRKSLEAACNEKDINAGSLAEELNSLEHTNQATYKYNEWDLGFLCDFIVNTHHRYVTKAMPDLVFYTQKIANVHGSHHPELLTVADLFSQINVELSQHMQNEEDVLFPSIKKALKVLDTDSIITIASEINRMLGEHDFAGGAMDQINKITKGYYLPADACKTYEVAFKTLRQFEDDLHVHVHLENNILFPKALKLTK